MVVSYRFELVPRGTHAAAHPLARMVYRLLKYGRTSVERGDRAYEQHFKTASCATSKKRAAHPGFQLIPRTTSSGRFSGDRVVIILV
jgi:hypothetical protein